ncbi:hypothetical protein Poli38472_007081 [Pythium oligandrum]|uniref:Uncharacterized protein n=1 Tax=Pythium oligandrum TaxID=41045 RepID=A0A8K1FE12_PYTOL|nr:hypothetical protein Poli38472_007081 [Pythium oligandrum]|eukprot:TMW58936.1 hypothetical protein Poli38472_007081 [Pythium oligandrum]
MSEAQEVDVYASEVNSPYAALTTPSNRNKVDTIVDIEVESEKEEKNQVSIAELFSFADKTDVLLMTVGTISALGAGVDISPDEFRTKANIVSRNFAIVGGAGVVGIFMQSACWATTAARQAKRIRSAYVRAILQKEIGWELALITLAFTPVLAVTTFFMMKIAARATQESIEAYVRAGAVAQEALSNIKTVHMFSAMDSFVTKYDNSLQGSITAGIRKAISGGASKGVLWFCTYSMYACGMFFGTLFVLNDRRDGCTGDKCYDGGHVLTVFMAVMIGGMGIGQVAPGIEAFTAARAAAYDMMKVIKRPLPIDPFSLDGKKLGKVVGQIDLEHIRFAYPSRPNSIVCTDYSLRIAPGETVALVGPSGSGKSTAIALLERFYDPAAGIVRLDGTDLRSLQLPWLRERISLVSQEPVLFAGTNGENIAMGKPGATREEVIDAAEKANAYPFISNFPQGFDTDVGDRGAQISGGQKQRIAIARAILRDPDVLLLDEATSALDNESERIVQESLDQLLKLKKRTTIIVAHRLSTIRHADLIAVTKDGEIVEQGTHDQLLSLPDGVYMSLVAKQMGDH